MKRNLTILAALGVAFSAAVSQAQDGVRLEGSGARREALNEMQGKPAPELQLARWVKGKPAKLADLKGKVVVLDFWGKWCGPCVASIPHNNELQKKFGPSGLVLLAVHTPWSAENVDQFVKEKGITYPVAMDASPDGKEGKTIRAYQVDSYPDYYVIDRKGVLRYADLANADVDKAIEQLLAEK